MRVAAGLLHLDDLVEDLGVPAGEERAAVDHHVDLVGAQRDRVLDVAQLDVERGLAGREVGRDAGDLHAAAGQALLRGRDQVRVDADRRDRRDVRVARIGANRLRAERGDLARRVLPLERGEVAAAQRELERPHLRVLLDRALRELGRALLDGDLVDRADSRQPLLQRQLEAPRECRRLGHHASVAPVRFHADKRRQAKYAAHLRGREGCSACSSARASWWVGGPIAVVFFALTVLLIVRAPSPAPRRSRSTRTASAAPGCRARLAWTELASIDAHDAPGPLQHAPLPAHHAARRAGLRALTDGPADPAGRRSSRRSSSSTRSNRRVLSRALRVACPAVSTRHVWGLTPALSESLSG